MSILSQKHFHDEAAAIARLETLVWPNGPVCPRCKGQERITKVKGGRPGLWRCGPCKRQFTAKVGTVFESSHVGLHLWFQAAHLMASSKKGISAHQLHRTLKVTYKTAWFMEHRLREAMRTGSLTPPLGHYKTLGKDFASHESVQHNVEEYVRGDAHVNTAESFFALFKRGMRGVYQHCSEKHLHRYLAEFDFRYNNRVALGVGDEARANRAISGIVGKRLMYRDSSDGRA